MLGLYVSDHPLQGLEGLLSQHADQTITSIIAEDGPQDGAIVTIAGMITSLSRRIAKASGNAYARAEIEDLGGSMEVMFFGQVYGPIASVLAEDLIVVVKGRLQRRDDGAVTLNCMELSVPDLSESLNGPVVITMQTHKATEAVVTRAGRRAADPPRQLRGPAAPAGRYPGGSHGPARSSAGQPESVALRRPQGPAGPGLPG